MRLALRTVFTNACKAPRPFRGLVRFYSPKLTAENYPVTRGNYAKLTDSDITYLESICKSVKDEDDLVPFNCDWMNKYQGQSKLALKPKTTEQVSKILKYCNEKNLAVVPQGGNTGLVAGSVPVFDEIVLSLSSMNKIRSFDNVSGILVADAGVILEQADTYLREHGFIFPLDLGAKGSCQIGGNVSTNAGGLRLLRYGSLHGSVLGLEVVLANGTILNALSTLRKDNTGYDLKQLFIGAEGTLGVITGVSILTPPAPSAVNVAFLAVESFEKVQKTFVQAKNELAEILSAFEVMDDACKVEVQNHTGMTPPLETDSPFYVLIETSGSNKEHDDAKLEAFLEKAMENENVCDGVVAQDETQMKSLWSWRELITESIGVTGVYKYDVSIPLSHLYEMVEDTRAHLKENGVMGDDDSHPVKDVVGFGHIGDSNLHLNIPVRRFDKKVESLLEPFVFEWIQKHKGSVSAEHGVGFAKKNFIGYSKSAEEINVMREIKNHFDPKKILNPYKYI